MSESEILTIALIVIGIVVSIHAVLTDNINWFYVKVWIPLGLVVAVIFNWLGLY
jgi:hypothetical protein